MIVFLLCLVSVSLYAQQKTLTIENQSPGWLSSKISYGDQQTVENLTVIGYLNNDDLRFIVSLAKNHSLHGRLDLEKANLVGDNPSKDNYLIRADDIFGADNTKEYNIIKLRYFSYPKSLINGDGEAMRCLIIDTLFINTTTGFTRALKARIKNVVIGDNITVLNYPSFGDNGNSTEDTIETVTFPPILKEIRGRDEFQPSEKTIYANIKNGMNLKEFPSLERLMAGFHVIKMPDSVFFPKIKVLSLNQYYSYYDGRMFKKGMHVFIGESIDTLTEMSCAYGINLHFSSPTPPYMEGSSSYHYKLKNKSEYILYVPKGSAKAYRACFEDGGTNVTIIEENVNVNSITLDKHELSLKVGESETIKVGIFPENASDKSIDWSSGNTDVAVVNNGKITAKKAGKAIITATSVSNPEIIDVCEVTVIQPVLAINIVESSITMVQQKDTKQLTAIVNPEDATDKTVIWSSTNENVATVDENGIVYAKNVGNATIIATSASNLEITDICEVIVIQPVTSVSMSDATFIFDGIGGIKQLLATVLPEDASNKSVLWDSSNKSVCTVSSSGMVVAVGVGTSVVSVTTVDGGYVAVCIVTVNETNGIVTMDIDSLSGNEKIYDAQGKRIFKLQRGINIIRMSDGTTRKVVVK